MLFSSMSFIFIFLPAVLILYFLAAPKYRNFILLAASIVFYAWGGINYLFNLTSVVLITYISAVLTEKYPKLKKIILISALLINFSFLFYFKYFNFISEIFRLNITLTGVILPAGISFYTFQAASYLIDVYKGAVKAQKSFLKTALYISLFPQLTAGPIVKYRDIENQLDSRTFDFDNFNRGAKRFIIGLAKKVIIADTMGGIADKIFSYQPDMLSVSSAWLGAFAYSFQIYFDFSGYSDMAIGLGLIFGFKFLENFNYPYISKSISEFWHRWHISLSSWFKEYVYIPLGGNRSGMKHTAENLLAVFMLTGIWHGAGWTFLAWGVYNGVFVIIEKIFGRKTENCPVYLNILKHLYCIAAFTAGWVIFRCINLQHSSAYIQKMYTGFLSSNSENLFYYELNSFEIFILTAAVILSMPVFKNILEIKNCFVKALINIWLLTLFIISAAAIASDTYNPFIYFRF